MRRPLLPLLFTLLAGVLPAAEPAITVSLNPAAPGPVIPADFAGLSYERNQVVPAADGSRYFQSGNASLLRLFSTLGIHHLRVGGNTADRDATTAPSDEDLDHLFDVAKAAKLKVIYCLRLLNGDPQENARLVQRLLDHHGGQVDSFTLGQEPSAYPVVKVDDRPNLERMGAGAEHYRYEDYRDAWKQHQAAILAAAPTARFSGPGVHSNAEWTRRFAEDFGQGHQVTMLLGHLYPCGNGKRITDPVEGRRRLLADDVLKSYQQMQDSLAPFAAKVGLPWRIEETNSFWNGGAAEASNSAAAALWGLDYLHQWAARGCAGINFHTGDRVAAGSTLVPPQYTAFVSADGGYAVRPLGYALAAFALGGAGRCLPVAVTGAIGCRAYGTITEEGTVTATVIRLDHGPEAQPRTVAIADGRGRRQAQLLRLAAPSVAALDGLTLGGATITTEGTWAGRWEDLTADAEGRFQLTMETGSAIVLRIP